MGVAGVHHLGESNFPSQQSPFPQLQQALARVTPSQPLRISALETPVEYLNPITKTFSTVTVALFSNRLETLQVIS